MNWGGKREDAAHSQVGANTLTGLKRAAGELLEIALEVLYTVDRVRYA